MCSKIWLFPLPGVHYNFLLHFLSALGVHLHGAPPGYVYALRANRGRMHRWQTRTLPADWSTQKDDFKTTVSDGRHSLVRQVAGHSRFGTPLPCVSLSLRMPSEMPHIFLVFIGIFVYVIRNCSLSVLKWLHPVQMCKAAARTLCRTFGYFGRRPRNLCLHASALNCFRRSCTVTRRIASGGGGGTVEMSEQLRWR